MTKKNYFFIFFVSLLFVYTATGQNLYVNWSDGNDANNGTLIGSPLKTIEEARLRALNNNMTFEPKMKHFNYFLGFNK